MNRSDPTLVVHRRPGGVEDLWDGATHVQFSQRQLVHDVRQLDRDKKHGQRRHRCENSRSTHPDLAELHLDLFGDDVGPVLFTEKVPEDPPQESVDPGLGLRGAFGAPLLLVNVNV